MTRVFTDGGETGDMSFWSGASNGSISSAVKRSGSYSYVQAGQYKNLATPLSEFYYRFAFHTTLFYNSTFVMFRDSNYNNFATLQMEQSSGLLYLYSNGVKVDTSTVTVPLTWGMYEFYVKIHDTSGVLTVKLDGVEILSYSGDTRPTNFDATVSQILHYSGAPGGYVYYIDDIALNDTSGAEDNSWCGDGKVIMLKSNGNGDASDLTGSDGNSTDNYLLVDDVPHDSDTTYVESATSGHRDLYGIEDFSGTGYTIKRVQVVGFAKDTVAAGGQCKLSIKPSGGSEDKSSAIDLLTSYKMIAGTDYTTNPADSQPWEDADLDGLQIGFEVV